MDYDWLSPTLEDAAYDCLSELAGVDTHDVDLRDHAEAWAAIKAFADKVRLAERERCAQVVRDSPHWIGPHARRELLAAMLPGA